MLPAADVRGGKLFVKSIRCPGEVFKVGCGPEESRVEGKSGALGCAPDFEAA